MTGDLRRTPLGALTVSVQLKADLAHNFTNSCRVRTEGACGVPRSQRLRETTGPTFQSAKRSDGLTKPWDDPTTARATVSLTFHTHWRQGYEIRERQAAKSPADHCD